MVILSELPQGSSTYDVFLSFRGQDTRHNFTDHLHKALVDATINVFLDDEEIETGEDLKPELERAIKESRASIIVLSQNYASSTWCLDELVMILERRRTSEHIVLPIFYKVEPTDIRKQRRSFGDAMAEHQRRIDAEADGEKKSQWSCKMEVWKKALTEVADLKGKDAHGRRETTFIEEIVKEISNRLDLHLRRDIPHLIGMRSSIETITTWLKDGSSSGSDILTVWGMGGIGKTSLARYIYQLNSHAFERSSFLEDIERTCAQQSNGLLDLQKQLLGDILKRSSIEVRDANVCTRKIEKALFSKQTLLVLDGVENFEQLDVLIGSKGFTSGTKIIITTKDGSLTEKCRLFGSNVPPKHTKHLLEGLYKPDALRLLCWHAFGHNMPDDYKEEVEKVVSYCAGHPLALKVLGSSLRNEDVTSWKDTVELLENEINPDIQKILQISFDSLSSENDKELFKHLACFFVGRNREFAETILKECGIKTKFGISKLIDKCLLTIGPKNELTMHQLLQEMGRELVRQESPGEPWKRSRLWCHKESFEVLKEDKGTDKIQGLVLDMKKIEEQTLSGSNSANQHEPRNDLQKNYQTLPLASRFHGSLLMRWCLFVWVFLWCFSFPQKESDLKTDALSKMEKLRLLELNYVLLSGSYKNFPKGLRWLSMHGFPLCNIPQDIPMEKMVALDMSYSNLEGLWKKPKLLKSLKILNLTSSKVVRVGDFSQLPALEWLILARCVSLVEVCESIGQCKNLVLLDLSYCIKLQKLPMSIRQLKKVRIMSIGGCANLVEFPSEIRDMKSLEVLNANDININSCVSSSTVVPRSLKSFSISLPHSLVSLSLENNNLFNESFPMDFRTLSMLKELNLNRNPIDCLPDCVRGLSRLEFLSLEGCHALKSVTLLPRTVKFLNTDNCTTLEKITLSKDRELIPRQPLVNYRFSESLNEVEGVRKIEPITQVDKEVLCSLGWSHLGLSVKEEVQMFDAMVVWDRPKKVPVQMIYEFGIFSTYFPGKAVPNCFSHRCKGSSISFTMPSSSKNLKGLNMCFVRRIPYIIYIGDPQIYVRNKTKKRTWVYECFLQPTGEADGEVSIACLSHWMFRKEELEDGDEISITFQEHDGVVERTINGVEVITECGVSLVFEDGNTEDNHLAYYKSWTHIIGGNLSPFRRKQREEYYHLANRYHIPPPTAFQPGGLRRGTMNTQDPYVVIKKQPPLFSYIPPYTYVAARLGIDTMAPRHV